MKLIVHKNNVCIISSADPIGSGNKPACSTKKHNIVN